MSYLSHNTAPCGLSIARTKLFNVEGNREEIMFKDSGEFKSKVIDIKTSSKVKSAKDGMDWINLDLGLHILKLSFRFKKGKFYPKSFLIGAINLIL